MQKVITIKNAIKRVPPGMELSRRIYWISGPVGLEGKVFRDFNDPGERFAVMRIVSLIHIYQQQFHEGKNLFVNIDWQTLEDAAGTGYRAFINWLVDKKVIEVNEWYSKEQKFSKSYKFSEKAKARELSVTRWETSDLEMTQREYQSQVSGSVFTPNGQWDQQLLYCLSHENKLRVRDVENRLEAMPIADASAASEWFHRINSGKSLPKPQDRSSRFYFNSIQMPRRFREHILYGEAYIPLINYDIKAAYPTFLKIMVAGQNSENAPSNPPSYICPFNPQRHRVQIPQREMDERDFYYLLQEGSEMTREQVKTEFNRYLNSRREVKETHIYTAKLKEVGYGDMADLIIVSEELWKVLETMETELLCHICDRCMDDDLVFIRQHDGFLTVPESVAGIEAILGTLEWVRFKSEKMGEL